jgi:hypothetical protein
LLDNRAGGSEARSKEDYTIGRLTHQGFGPRRRCTKLGKRAALHAPDTANHGFRALQRSRQSAEDVFVEMGRVVGE